MAMILPTATIDAAALRHNLAAVRRYAPNSRVLAAVKANAYGHGLIPAARAFADADALGVARIEEAIALREAAMPNAILLLEGVFSSEQLTAAAGHDLQVVVHSFDQLSMLEQYSGARRFAVWLKVDTGLNRLGFMARDVTAVWNRLQRCPSVGRTGLMTHLASAEQPNSPDTRQQLERFRSLAQPLGAERSIANSAGLIAWPDARVEWVRPGLMLYGISPFAHTSAAELGLRPAMTLSTRLIAVRNVEVGERIGYSGIWRAQRPSRIGIAAIGYGDGYPRGVGAGALVLINGRQVPVAGRVSMDMTTIDVTDVPDAKAGDIVTLWGEGLSVERVAQFAGTISYELVCRVNARVISEWRG